MNNLQRLRKERKISQTKLAEQLNVSQATLSFWENGKYDIDNESLLKLSNIFSKKIVFSETMQHEMQHEINKKRGCIKHPLPAIRYKLHNISEKGYLHALTER